MIGVLVTFTQTDKFDRSTIAKIAGELRGPFEGMAGLRFKSFMLDEDGVQARNSVHSRGGQAATGGSHGVPVRASRMACMAVSPWARAVVR